VKVVVAGGLGFLGANAVRRLEERGHEPLPVSRRTGVDIRGFDQINRFLARERPEVVINCAAHVGGIAYNALAPVEVYEDNLLIGFNLVRACYQNGVGKLVNIMPNCTYPGVAEVYREDEWWQGEMHDTVLTYGMPRKAAWVQCWAYKQKYGFNSIHLVLPNLYGPGDHFDPVHPVREWGYVEDAAEGIVLAMKQYNDIDILNLGEGKGYTIKEIAEIIKETVGWEGEFVFDPARPDGAPRKVLEVKKMRKLLGWEPRTPITEGIRKTVEWYTQNMLQKEGGER